MISRTRTDILAPLVLFLTIVLVSLLGFSLIAHASDMPVVATTTSVDPGGLLGLLLTGHYLPAIGAGLVIFVGLARSGAGSFWPWLQTRIGGYVLAYVTSYALYLGTAWQSGAAWDPRLLLMAATAALAASGVLEHWKDIVEVLTRAAPAAAKSGSAAMLVLVVLGLTGAVTIGAACGPKTKAIGSAVWDCSAPARADAVAAVTPAVISVIRAAGSADGKVIDASTVRSAISKANVLTEAGVLLSCAFASAVAILEAPTLAPAAGAPASSPYELDPAAVAKVWAEIDATQLGGAHFLVASGRVL